MKAVAGGTRKK